MFQGAAAIEELVQLFEKRRMTLFHACQLVDFQTYLMLGGIPSRAHMERASSLFTKLETDMQDHENSVWDKVFANLYDWGRVFTLGRAGVPNAYGPILLHFRPAALREASDVSITLHSAGGKGFNREQDSLCSIEEVNKLFQYSMDAEFNRNVIKFIDELRRDFPNAREVAVPEINCTVRSGRFSTKHLIRAEVDPYIIKGRSLYSLVDAIRKQTGASFEVRQRLCSVSVQEKYNELASLIEITTPPLYSLCHNDNVSEEMRDWIEKLIQRGQEYQFRRYAKYLREGTLDPILSKKH